MPKVKEKIQKTTAKKEVKTKITPKNSNNPFSIPVFSLKGEVVGNLNLPKEVFGIDVNTGLLLQALRVYQSNQKSHFASTKTRGEVEGSTRKIYRQKHTGRARHGSVMAPIFVGGGIALGPKYRKVYLDLPKKMKKKALLSALSLKTQEKEVLGVEGLEKIKGKTKEMDKLLRSVQKKSALLIIDKKNDLVQRAARNIPNFDVLTADQVNTLEIIKHQSLVLTKEAVSKLTERIKGEKKE